MEEVRLQKFLAESGIASRRKAEELIREGRISVNGVAVTTMGIKVSEHDEVTVDGKRVSREDMKVYIMLHKPEGVVSTAKDQFSRTTVLDLIPGLKERIYPVGRLDYDTSGLILLTNDGDFTYGLTHPSHEVEKVYIAEIGGMITIEQTARFETGLVIGGRITSPASLKVLARTGRGALVEIAIHEGMNRQVRKMCEAVGHPVLKLKRIAIGGVTLGSLPEGKWRHLEMQEINRLKEKIK